MNTSKSKLTFRTTINQTVRGLEQVIYVFNNDNVLVVSIEQKGTFVIPVDIEPTVKRTSKVGNIITEQRARKWIDQQKKRMSRSDKNLLAVLGL